MCGCTERFAPAVASPLIGRGDAIVPGLIHLCARAGAAYDCGAALVQLGATPDTSIASSVDALPLPVIQYRCFQRACAVGALGEVRATAVCCSLVSSTRRSLPAVVPTATRSVARVRRITTEATEEQFVRHLGSDEKL